MPACGGLLRMRSEIWACAITRILCAGPGEARLSPLARGLLIVPRKKARGTARRLARLSFSSHLLSKVWRLSARRPAFSLRRRAALSSDRLASARVRKDAPRWAVASATSDRPLNGPPSASSSQGAVVPPGGAPAPPECVAANHARGRRPDPHERRNRFASPQGIGRCGLWS